MTTIVIDYGTLEEFLKELPGEDIKPLVRVTATETSRPAFEGTTLTLVTITAQATALNERNHIMSWTCHLARVEYFAIKDSPDREKLEQAREQALATLEKIKGHINRVAPIGSGRYRTGDDPLYSDLPD